jgi:hypothetical protein
MTVVTLVIIVILAMMAEFKLLHLDRAASALVDAFNKLWPPQR